MGFCAVPRWCSGFLGWWGQDGGEKDLRQPAAVQRAEDLSAEEAAGGWVREQRQEAPAPGDQLQEGPRVQYEQRPGEVPEYPAAG